MLFSMFVLVGDIQVSPCCNLFPTIVWNCRIKCAFPFLFVIKHRFKPNIQVKCRLNSEKTFYHSVHNRLSYFLLYKNVMIEIQSPT
jgi:hypothetical protein